MKPFLGRARSSPSGGGGGVLLKNWENAKGAVNGKNDSMAAADERFAAQMDGREAGMESFLF
jgi:hypothetical protein